jgi:hypothetical protein
MICCGPNNPWMTYDPLSVLINDFEDQGVLAINSCSQRQVTVTSDFPTWWTDNTSIATASGYQITGVAIGTTNNNAQSINMYWGPKEDSGGGSCPLSQEQPSAPTDVGPQITSISPSRGLIGAVTSSITITGKGFTGGHVNTPAAILVKQYDSYTDTEIVLDLNVSSTAIPGKNAAAIYVTVSGHDSNKVDFYVQVPTSLSIVSGSASGTTEKLCTSNACGTIVSFKYQVYDQDSPTAQPIRNVMSFWDSFGTFNPDGLNLQGSPLTTTCSPNQTNSGPCNANTYSDGTFTEAVLGGCAPVCCVGGVCTTGGPSGVPQTWHIAASSIVQQISEYCQKVLVNGTQVQ